MGDGALEEVLGGPVQDPASLDHQVVDLFVLLDVLLHPLNKSSSIHFTI
jgi:hypothetical protein